MASRFFFGQVVVGQVVKRGIERPDTVRVKCLRMRLDKYLNQYFNWRKHYWAVERDMKVDVGDIVLIKRMPERLTVLCGHEIVDVMYKLGTVVDPVTGKRCRGMQFIDDAERTAERERIEAERN